MVKMKRNSFVSVVVAVFARRCKRQTIAKEVKYLFRILLRQKNKHKFSMRFDLR